MLEVCERFPKIGDIPTYQALPIGERILYDRYALMKIEAETRTPAIKLELPKK
ncbi:hypothetical protein LQZ18_01640 [Lachnospiraceae bacterium ZAX-1]